MQPEVSAQREKQEPQVESVLPGPPGPQGLPVGLVQREPLARTVALARREPMELLEPQGLRVPLVVLAQPEVAWEH